MPLFARSAREAPSRRSHAGEPAPENRLNDDSTTSAVVTDVVPTESEAVAELSFAGGWDMFSVEQRGQLLDELERTARASRPATKQLGSLRA